MKIAVLSDIHDNVWNLKRALAGLPQADALLCLGDLCSPFIIGLLADGFPGRPIHIVFGNNDGDLFRITKNAGQLKDVHLHGEIFHGEMDDKKLVAVHFDSIALDLAQTGQFEAVFYGHNHRYRNKSNGPTLLVNPGAIMGYDPSKKKEIDPTLAIYDTQSGLATGYRVNLEAVEPL